MSYSNIPVIVVHVTIYCRSGKFHVAFFFVSEMCKQLVKNFSSENFPIYFGTSKDIHRLH